MKKLPSGKKRFLFFLVIAFITSCLVFAYAEQKIKPLLKNLAMARVTSLATLALNEAVEDVLNETEIEYKDIIFIEKNDDGRIISVKTDISLLNKLKTQISIKAVNKIFEIDDGEVGIPIGSLLNGELTYGRGPEIYIKFIPAGSVKSDIFNEFSEAGINQTRHQIIVNVKAEIYIILPSETLETVVENDFMLAETIIVGEIPNFYVQ